jgi:oligopeptide transport system substrate-binding protein
MSLPLEDGLASRLDDMDGQDLKTRTFEGVEMLLRCAASQAPLVLVCEDLHWADPTSIELLTRVLSVAGEVPLLLLCILRPVKDHSCWRFRDLAAQQYPGQYTDVLLDPLSPDESQTLVANLLEVDDLPAVLRRRVLSRAEGNPFYVEEVIRSLIDRHAITLDARTGRWTARSDVGEIPIPDTLQGVLMARIDRLQEDTKRVLQLAAVIGRTFLHRVLAEIAVEERRLDRQLLTLQQEEMIRQRARIPELEYIFKHDLTREAAYNGLLKRQRRAFHRQVAETLEQLFAERVEEQAGLLAHHWERAGDAEKAIPYLQRAGDAARLMYSHEEAISYYRRALVLLMQQEEHEQAARTWMKLGLTYHTAFRFRESRQAYEEGSAVRLEASRTGVPAALPAAPHALRQTLPEPTTLDPSKCSDAFAGCAIDHLFDGLLRLTPDMDVTPDLARAWEVSEDGRKYVFELRDDASWSDGTPVTAQDFEYAWKRILDPASASDNASFLYDLKGARQFHQGEISDPNAIGVRASDEWTLVLELEEPAGYFLQLMSHSAAYPLPRHAVRAHGEAWADADNLVTNGPFRLQAWHPGESMVLERSPGYRGRFAGNLHRVELVFVDPTNKQRLLESYEADQLDVLDTTYFPPALVEHARQRRANECVVGPDLSTIYLGFNVRQPPLADLRVRRAFVLASDRETLADVAHLGQRFPALGGFVPPGMPGHSPGIGLPYQPEEARQLLAEAGHPGGGGFPALDCVALGVSTTAVEWLREHWREILGIETTWRILDWVTFVERMSNEEPPNLWIWAWGADYPDPDNFLRVGFPWDLTGWRNSNYDRLVEKARRAMDQEERIQLYREADRIVVQEAPIMPAFHMRRQILVKPWVRKYPASAVTMSVWQDVVIEPH